MCGIAGHWTPLVSIALIKFLLLAVRNFTSIVLLQNQIPLLLGQQSRYWLTFSCHWVLNFSELLISVAPEVTNDPMHLKSYHSMNYSQSFLQSTKKYTWKAGFLLSWIFVFGYRSNSPNGKTDLKQGGYCETAEGFLKRRPCAAAESEVIPNKRSVLKLIRKVSLKDVCLQVTLKEPLMPMAKLNGPFGPQQHRYPILAQGTGLLSITKW